MNCFKGRREKQGPNWFFLKGTLVDQVGPGPDCPMDKPGKIDSEQWSLVFWDPWSGANRFAVRGTSIGIGIGSLGCC